MPIRKLLLAIFLFFFITLPVKSQGPIYLPIIEANMIKPLKSTIAITLPYGNQNYVLNPSGEIAGNFANEAGGAVTRSTLFQKYGLYSYEVLTTNNGDGINLDLLTLDNLPYFVTFLVHSTNGAQDNVSLDVTLGAKTNEARLLQKVDRGTGVQWDLYGASFSAGEANGQTNLLITQRGSDSSSVYIDGVQAEPMTTEGVYTTYIDGTQDGCRWLGAPHSSASTRSADSRAGGVVTNFWEGFNFFPEKALGAGTAVEELNIDSYAFLPGGELNSSKIPPREFTIIGYFLADTVEELHEHAQRLELELGLNTYPGRQPVRLRYSGARVLKEISANYTGGLEGDLPIYYNDDQSQEDEKWVRNYSFKMRASIGFVALDPFWYEVGESATLLDTHDSGTFSRVAARKLDGTWDTLGGGGPAGAFVYSIIEDETYTYFGGDFANWDGIANADNIVRLNKQTGTYSAMGTGTNGSVRALVKMPNGDIIAGGIFTLAGGVANTSRIARWVVATETWEALGTGAADNIVYALTVGLDGKLYAAGTFSLMGGVANTRKIAFWDGAWNPMGTGADAGLTTEIQALVTIPTTGYIVAAGNMDDMGGVADTAFIAYWDFSTWVTMGSGLSPGDIFYSLAADAKGNVYAGGSYTVVNGISANNIAYWNSSIWFAMGEGVTNGVSAASVVSLSIASDGLLHAGGAFIEAGGIDIADGFASWNGYTWFHLGVELPGVLLSSLSSRVEADPIVPTIYALYLGFVSSGNLNSSGVVAVDNEGTISAFPKIVFNRSGGDGAIVEILRNNRTGRTLLFDYSLLDGESLTINLNPKNRTIVSSFFGPRMDAHLPNDDFSIWQLLPGENSVSAFVSEDSSPTVLGYLLWREPYKGWN